MQDMKSIQAGLNKLKNIAVGFVKEEAAWKRLYGSDISYLDQ